MPHRKPIFMNPVALLLAWTLALAAWSVQARGIGPDFTHLVEEASPVVVNISTTQTLNQKGGTDLRQYGLPELPEDSPFGELFRHFFGAPGQNGPDALPEFKTRSLGSGFIISADGYILTNNHVVQDADEIVVRLSDRRELIAEVIGGDKRSDVAVLKVEAEDLPVARLGRSEELKVGEWVLAIGSPFGFDSSATAGIVSAKGRALPRENYVPYIQTDVAINPGNSGGPLFNLDGEVVGMNSQIFTRSGGYMGLSFAIPIEMALNVAEQIKANGHVTRGWLGVMIQDVTRELAESFGMDRPYGALVSQVMDDSPAAAAGIKVGDIIVGYEGREVDSSTRLPPMVGNTAVGEEVTVQVMRDGRRKVLRVTIGELPTEDALAAASPGSDPAPVSQPLRELGLKLTDLDARLRKQLGVEGGVLISELDDGPGSRAGLRRGDVLISFAGRPVSDVAGLAEQVAQARPGAMVPVRVLRDGSPLFLALRMPG